MVTLIALIRKIIVIVNGKLRERNSVSTSSKDPWCDKAWGILKGGDVAALPLKCKVSQRRTFRLVQV